MKILYITYENPYFPGGNGGQTRQYFLLKNLSGRHEFHYVGPLVTGEELNKLQDIFQTVTLPQLSLLNSLTRFLAKRIPHAYPRFVQQLEGQRVLIKPLIHRVLKQHDYDLIHVEHSNIAHWLHGIANNIPKILVAQNVKTIMWERYYQQALGVEKKRLYRDYERFKAYEKKYFGDYNGIVSVSDVDNELIKGLYGDETPLFIVPNGVDVDYFSPQHDLEIMPETLVFTGSMAHPPNNEAVLYFCRKIFNKICEIKPSCRLFVVGSSPSKEVKALANGHNIFVTGFVDDTRPYIATASVVIVPLLSGSGTRLKIMESMGMGKAIVSTSIGAEGIEYTDGENIIIADDEELFANKVIELMNNRQKAIEIGQNARKLVEENYSWKILADRLDSVYRAVVCR